MSQTKSLVVLAGAALSLGGAAFAEQAAWSSANADEVRALVAEMMADAQTRSSLLQGGATAGHDGKFFLASSDGNFRLNVSGQIQFRYIATFLDDDAPGVDDFDQGFQTRRTKLAFSGHVFDPNLFYKVQGAFRRDGGAGAGGGDFQLEDAYVGYKWDNGWMARWGQFKLPFLREELVSSSKQLAVERSVVNEEYNQDYSQGIEAGWQGDWARFALAFSDGFASRNSDIGADPADYAFTGRVEFLLGGDWKQFEDFTSFRGSDFAWMIGVAGHYEKGPDIDGSSDPAQVIPGIPWFALATADISVEGDGWNLFGAVIYQHFDNDQDGAASVDSDDFGFVAQGGVFLTEELELFGRYDHLLPDGDRGGAVPVPGSTDDAFKTITAGVNYYMHGHAAKFTFDVAWYLDDTSSTALGAIGLGPGGLNSGTGLLPSTEENQFSIRAQFQLLF